MIERMAKTKLLDLANKFKAIAVIGPRQSGKTTLVRSLFAHKPYVSLENPDDRNFALEDPRAFLLKYPEGAVFDEIQRVPELFSYMQELLDNTRAKGHFILSGSNHFLLQQSISQSLAGRVGYLHLLPFSLQELEQSKLHIENDDVLMLQGFYPPVYDQNIPAQDWCPNYVKTYIEKDVRQIKNINDLHLFERFLRLLAGRVGYELNYTALAVETGIDTKTVQSWIGILESSFIIYNLKPHHLNFRKTLVKRPKLYFYDTSIVCYLLGIYRTEHLTTHPMRGNIFENMAIGEILKIRTHQGLSPDMYFWRDKTGHEVDLILQMANDIIPIEIKSGQTFNTEFIKQLRYYQNISGCKKSYVLYGGQQNMNRSDGIEIINWRSGCRKIAT
ncbi:MAG: ATP-binding protein [Saprospiraceae bacterium]|nr:ATP-binding protein [Saprospiraceae bacterium]